MKIVIFEILKEDEIMDIISTIKEEFKLSFDNVTNNRKIAVIIRRLANRWYDGVYKGEQRRNNAIALLKQEGVWNLLNIEDKCENNVFDLSEVRASKGSRSR